MKKNYEWSKGVGPLSMARLFVSGAWRRLPVAALVALGHACGIAAFTWWLARSGSHVDMHPDQSWVAIVVGGFATIFMAPAIFAGYCNPLHPKMSRAAIFLGSAAPMLACLGWMCWRGAPAANMILSDPAKWGAQWGVVPMMILVSAAMAPLFAAVLVVLALAAKANFAASPNPPFRFARSGLAQLRTGLAWARNAFFTVAEPSEQAFSQCERKRLQKSSKPANSAPHNPPRL